MSRLSLGAVMKITLRFVVVLFSFVATFSPLLSQEILHFEQIVELPEDSPVFAAFAPGEPNRLYSVGSNGVVRIFDMATDELLPEPFLKTPGFLTCMVFHPDYAMNGRVFVFADMFDAGILVEEYGRTSQNRAERVQTILRIEPNVAGHPGGWMDFGPDGFLHISIGDSFPMNSLLGGIWRIDVDGDDFPDSDQQNYAIPADNPLAGESGAEELIAYGLRNPWRCSFDPAGNLFIADVGGAVLEEVDVIPAGHLEVVNFGWPCFEGTLESPGSLIDFFDVDCVGQDIVAGPVFEYEHQGMQGNAIIGGYVYNGEIDELRGHYLFVDHLQDLRNLQSFIFDETPSTNEFDGTNIQQLTSWQLSYSVPGFNSINSFSEDENGNLFIVDSGGRILKLDSLRPLGDFNGDQLVDLLDVTPFVEAISSNDYVVLADINCNGLLDEQDVYLFTRSIVDLRDDTFEDFESFAIGTTGEDIVSATSEIVFTTGEFNFATVEAEGRSGSNALCMNNLDSEPSSRLSIEPQGESGKLPETGGAGRFSVDFRFCNSFDFSGDDESSGVASVTYSYESGFGGFLGAAIVRSGENWENYLLLTGFRDLSGEFQSFETELRPVSELGLENNETGEDSDFLTLQLELIRGQQETAIMSANILDENGVLLLAAETLSIPFVPSDGARLFPAFSVSDGNSVSRLCIDTFQHEVVESFAGTGDANCDGCLLYTSPSPRDATLSRMPSSA